MKRRTFIAGLGGAVAWPFATPAQQGNRMPRIGVLMPFDENDLVAKAWFSSLTRGLSELGWTVGSNVQMDVRWSDDFDRMRIIAKAMVDLQPDVIVVTSPPATRAVQQQTQTIPIIFVGGGDPFTNGLVRSASHPEGNTTGFARVFASIGGKLLELLKEAVPRVTRVAIVFNPETSTGIYLPSIEAAAAEYAVTAIKAPVRNAVEIERAIQAFATEPNGGLIVLPPQFPLVVRQAINRLVANYRLPAIDQDRGFATAGGLMSYGSDIADLYRRGASYVDRVLRGAKVNDLPVQFPTKFELVVNLKTAKAMGLTISEPFLSRADLVIE